MTNSDRDNGTSDTCVVTGEHTATATTAADVSATATTATEDEVFNIDNARWNTPSALCGEHRTLEGKNGITSNGGYIPCSYNLRRTCMPYSCSTGTGP